MLGETSRVISLLRFPLAVMVVFIHTRQFQLVEPLQTIETVFSSILPRIAVPTFFVISGYLFFQKLEEWDWNIYKKKCKKRFFTLLIPYVVWITIRIFFNKNYDYFVSNSVFSIYSYLEAICSNVFIYGSFWHYTFVSDSTLSVPIHTAFWFLRDLIVLVVVSPLIYWLIRKFGGGIVMALGVVFLCSFWPRMQFVNIISIFFFTTGAYICIKGGDLIDYAKSKKFCLFIYSVLFLTFLHPHFQYDNRLVKSILESTFLISGVLTAILGGSYLVNYKLSNVIIRLSDTSFFIYAFHIFVIILLKPLEAYLTINAHNGIIFYFLYPFLAVGFSVCIYYSISKISPSLMKILCGR